MGFNSFTSGKNINFSDELNENSAAYITQSGLNLIRQLKNRDVVLNGFGQDGYALAFDNGHELGGYDSNGNSFNFGDADVNSYTDNTNVEPPYYDTVMVMRIK